jgi:myo-inositol 2-dehydrogenase/D-chiro-inositol 1-dehydrogenase
MGGDHARIIASSVGRAHVAAIYDADLDRAKSVAAATAEGRVAKDSYDLISDKNTGAVLIASPDATHADFVLACLRAGKPVLCEKPLAPTPEDCLKVIEAEMAGGRRLVQVGFMRRFDPSYREMKAMAASGRIGPILALHCVHRNAAVPGWFEWMMPITNSAVHEFDIARFLLDDEIARITVHKPKPSSLTNLQDPMFLVLETEKGRLVTIDLFLNASYGYDVRTEIVCERGTVTMTPPDLSHVRSDGREAFSFAADWRPRFSAAYMLQTQDWVKAIVAGRLPAGSSAWDGYVASAVAAAGVEALKSGRPTEVKLVSRPEFYRDLSSP